MILLNFTFLKNKTEFQDFAEICIEAEKGLMVSPSSCAMLTRRALEQAVHYMYKNDIDLQMPYRDNLSVLVNEYTFKQIVPNDVYEGIKYIVKLGNYATHTNAKVNREEAVLALNNLYRLISWINYSYGINYQEQLPKFDPAKLPDQTHMFVNKDLKEQIREILTKQKEKEAKQKEELARVIAENVELRKQGAAKRKEEKAVEYIDVNNALEWQTRKLVIDLQLKEAGWDFDTNVEVEFPVHHMPTESQDGYVDYILRGRTGKIIAVIEAKKTSANPRIGRNQAKLYADCIEKEYGLRPVIFYTNGYETYIWDDMMYPDRRISSIFSQDEIQLLIDRRDTRRSISKPVIQDAITNRYYQKEAIVRTCEDFEKGSRKALLVMATGSGKTRVAISLVDVLTKADWAKNILFLADRTALVRQAKKSFVNLLPSLTTCNLCENKEDPEVSRMIFSTYPTMMNAIDETRRKDGNRLFTPGHFDLIILDESHRSIYNRYKDIFDYFDALLIGLTATPKDSISMNTYSIFDLETGVPTYAYEYEKAVKDKYLVSYHSYETKLKFLEEGICYDDLSEEEKEEFDTLFPDVDTIESSLLNKFIFNLDTIDTVIRELMEHGIKIEGGDKIGKTIIFAANQDHAHKIKERFDVLYPEYKGKLAEVVTFNTKYVQNAIDRFSKTDSYPQIAISVDMLDTGIDVPDIVNLVFFKKVRSKSKFWQMIGRGTRLRKDLFGPGDDKKEFLIFDYLGNMEYFRVNKNAEKSGIIESLSQRIYKLRVDILYALEQNATDQDYVDEINKQIKEMSGYIQSLNEDSFNVKLRLKYVHQYKNPDNWRNLNEMDTHYIKDELSSLVVIHDEDTQAKFFDRQMYMIEMAYLNHYDATSVINNVVAIANELYKKQATPDIARNAEYLKCAKDPDYWKTANYFDLEVLREKIRGLIKYLTKDDPVKPIDTHFTDEIIETKMNDAFYNDEGLENYKEKVQHYLKSHEDDEAIYKLRHNQVITPDEMKHLENLLWIDLGSKDDYRLHFGDTPITRLIRKIVGLDRQAAMAEFSRFLDDQSLNSRQIHFVELIVDYIVKNGFIEDRKVLLQDPFKSVGSMSALFKDKMNIARDILKTVDIFSERL